MNNFKQARKLKREGNAMVIWLLIMLIMGSMIMFFQNFVIDNSLLLPIGLVIMLICIGLGVRITFFRQKGEKEKYLEEIDKLKKQVSELQSSGKEAGQ